MKFLMDLRGLTFQFGAVFILHVVELTPIYPPDLFNRDYSDAEYSALLLIFCPPKLFTTLRFPSSLVFPYKFFFTRHAAYYSVSCSGYKETSRVCRALRVELRLGLCVCHCLLVSFVVMGAV
ncbi:hypothetical protein SRHO_G00042690 [Serrasalmus rhombeus]